MKMQSRGLQRQANYLQVPFFDIVRMQCAREHLENMGYKLPILCVRSI